MSDAEDVSVSGGSVTPRGVHHVLLGTDESQNQSTFTVKFNNGGAEGIFRVKYDNEVEGRAVLLADPRARPHAESAPLEKRKSVVAFPSPPPLDSQAPLHQVASGTLPPSEPIAESGFQHAAAIITDPESSSATSMASASATAASNAETAATAAAAAATMAAAAATAATTAMGVTSSATGATAASQDAMAAAGAAPALVHEAKPSSAETLTSAGYPAARPKLPAVSHGLISGAPRKSTSSAAPPMATPPAGLQKQAPHFMLEAVGVASGVRQDLCCEASGPATLRVGREVQSLDFWSKLVPHEASRTGISREHFEIHENAASPSGFSIVNLSRAGTVRNGVSVKPEDLLDIGDVITLGVDQSPEAKAAGLKLAAIQFHFVVPFSSLRYSETSVASTPRFLVRLTCNHVAGRSAVELAQLPDSARSLESRKDSPSSAALLRVGRSLQVAMWWEKLLSDARLVNSISREHFQIRLQADGAPLLRNLSAAGTFVNGRSVRESCAIAVGDRIGIPSCKPEEELSVEFEYHQIHLAAGEQSPTQDASSLGTQDLSRTPVMERRSPDTSENRSPDLFHIMQEAAALPTETSLPMASASTVSGPSFSFECVSVRGQDQDHVAKLTAEVARVLVPAADQLSFRVGRTVQAMRFWEVLVPDAAARNALSRECFEVAMTKELQPSFCMQNLSGHGTMLNEVRVHTQAHLRHGDVLGIGAAQASPGGSELLPVVQLRFVTSGMTGSQDVPAFSPKEPGNIENESTTASTDNRDGCEMQMRKLSTASTATVVQSRVAEADVDDMMASREDILVRSPCELAEADPLRLSHSAILPPIGAMPKFSFEEDDENPGGVDNLTSSLGKKALGKLVEQESQLWALEGSLSSIERAVKDQEMTPAEAREQLAELEGKLLGLQCHGVDSVDLQGLASDSATEARLLKQELTQKSAALQSRLERIFESLRDLWVV